MVSDYYGSCILFDIYNNDVYLAYIDCLYIEIEVENVSCVVNAIQYLKAKLTS